MLTVGGLSPLIMRGLTSLTGSLTQGKARGLLHPKMRAISTSTSRGLPPPMARGLPLPKMRAIAMTTVGGSHPYHQKAHVAHATALTDKDERIGRDLAPGNDRDKNGRNLVLDREPASVHNGEQAIAGEGMTVAVPKVLVAGEQ
jgi:hypothetical protein